ncbi:MAG: VacJ family lipoprotein [Syntrophales bacterium]
MKSFKLSVLLFVFAILVLGCAHRPSPISSFEPSSVSPQHNQVIVASNLDQIPLSSPEMSPKPEGERLDDVSAPQDALASPVMPSNSDDTSVDDDDNLDYVEENGTTEKISIADPLEPFNRAMYQFNDKLYFWLLKPVAQGYRKIVPEGARVSVRNFFSNLTSPIRIVNCMLQANFGGAARELGRFTVNTILGIGGLFDPASGKNINLPKQDEDFGQTLGVYGLGQGFYINWPILGPSSPRDTVGLVGDLFLHPFNYLATWDVSVGTRAYEKVNDTSLTIGDYESLKEAAIDPYVALRDAYVQYRLNKVKARGGKPAPSDAGGAVSTATEEAPPSVHSGETTPY